MERDPPGLKERLLTAGKIGVALDRGIVGGYNSRTPGSGFQGKGEKMEVVREVVGTEGLQIPLPIIQRYGLQPGAGVVLELGADQILIRPALLGPEEIESRALRYLLAHLGDAVTVQVERKDGGWWVSVYGAGRTDPLGYLVYSTSGEFLPERSTPIEELRRQPMGNGPLP